MEYPSLSKKPRITPCHTSGDGDTGDDKKCNHLSLIISEYKHDVHGNDKQQKLTLSLFTFRD